jgi:hypothetical protein
MQRYLPPLRPLTRQLEIPRSPVRRFFDARLAGGLPGVQRRYREGRLALAVPPVPVGAANPGTLGAAADWLLRFLLHPRPALDVALYGLASLVRSGVDARGAVQEIAAALGVVQTQPRQQSRTFAGPVVGSDAEPEALARACWVLALLTEVFRARSAAAKGPLGRFRGRSVSGGDLLALAPPAGLDQLRQFRRVFEDKLIPQLAHRPGIWALGGDFSGSRLISADCDVIAGGLLLDLKTSASSSSVSRAELFQLIGYSLLDLEDAYRISEVATFSARYGRLAIWGLQELVDELAGRTTPVADLRREFQDMLTTEQVRAADQAQERLRQILASRGLPPPEPRH